MGIAVFVIDILAITLTDATVSLHITPCFITRSSTLLYFLSTVIVLIFFLVVSLIRHQTAKFLQF